MNNQSTKSTLQTAQPNARPKFAKEQFRCEHAENETE